MYKHIQKALDWGVKIASLAITGPATWVVATELFTDINDPILLFVMRFAAVFLIEGVLLSNWLLLEFDVKATPGIKARYGITALVMYAALAVIGWKHEGPAGLVFRIALLAALIGSGWDTYVYTWHQATRNVDRSAVNAARVKRHARKLSIREAILRREADHKAALKLIDAEGMAALEQNSLYGQRLIDRVHLEDKAERATLQEQGFKMGSASETGMGSNGKKKQSLTHPHLDSASNPSGSASSGLTENQVLRLSILDAFAEDPRYTQTNLAEKLGVSRGRVATIVRKLASNGYIEREGRHVYLTEKGERALRSNASLEPSGNGNGNGRK